jgi:hypothetical protein
MPWRHMEVWRYSSTTLDLGIRWWVVSYTLLPLYPLGRETLVPNGQEAGWAQELLWMLWSRQKSLAPARNRAPAVQPIACHSTGWDVLASHTLYMYFIQIHRAVHFYHFLNNYLCTTQYMFHGNMTHNNMKKYEYIYIYIYIYKQPIKQHTQYFGNHRWRFIAVSHKAVQFTTKQSYGWLRVIHNFVVHFCMNVAWYQCYWICLVFLICQKTFKQSNVLQPENTQYFTNNSQNKLQLILWSSELWLCYTRSLVGESPTVNMVAVCFSEPLVPTYETTTWCHNPIDHNMNVLHSTNLKSYISYNLSIYNIVTC